MTVFELLERIAAAYPGATAEAMKSFKPVFYARLKDREGDALDAAANEVLGSFRPKATQPFPIPADFEAHLPSRSLKLSAGGGGINLKAHGERKRRLMDTWRREQLPRAAAGINEVRRALEVIAAEKADRLAWRDNPEPVMLTRKDVRLAQQRAISVQRVLEFGAIRPTLTAEVWWSQIQDIAGRWRIETQYGDWARETKKEAA